MRVCKTNLILIFITASHVLAHADPPTGDALHFNDKFRFTDNRNNYNLLWIATHEFGHNLGIDHSSDSNAIMRSTYRLPSNIALHADDIAAIRALYGRSIDTVTSQ